MSISQYASNIAMISIRPEEENFSIRNCRFAFKCDKQWNDLEETEDNQIKFCNTCEKEVHFCDDDYELARNIRLNRFVAFVRENQMLVGDVVGS